jgi:hypothetical protein
VFVGVEVDVGVEVLVGVAVDVLVEVLVTVGVEVGVGVISHLCSIISASTEKSGWTLTLMYPL